MPIGRRRESNRSEEYQLVVAPQTPGAPVDLSVVEEFDADVLFSLTSTLWTDVYVLRRYALEAEAVADTGADGATSLQEWEFAGPGATSDPTVVPLHADEIPDDTAYWYRAFPRNDHTGGPTWGTGSNVVSAQTLDLDAPAAAVLSNLVAGDGEIDLDIALPGDGETIMYVYRDPSAGASTLIDTVAPAATYNDPTVSNGTEYFYRVKLEDVSGNVSTFSNEVSGTPAVGGPADLYFTTEDDTGAVYAMPKDGSSAPVELFDEGTVEVRQLWCDTVNGFIYYARYEASGVNCGIKRRVLSDGSGATLLHNVTLAWGVAVDVAGDRIYWADGNNVIGHTTLAGASPTNLYTSVSNPSGLALDLVNGRIYAALQGIGRVTRGTPGGAARVTYNAASTTNFDWVTHDPTNNYIYAGGAESAVNGRLRRYAEAFTASDGTETDLLGITTVTGAVWDDSQGRIIYVDGRVFKSCLPDGTDVQTIRDCTAQFANPLFNLALG